MNIKIDVILNEKGQKLTSKNTYSIRITRDCGIPGDDEIEKIIYEEVPKELVEKYEISYGGFIDLKVGDYIKIINPSNNSYKITKVSKINDKFIGVENYNSNFDYNGKEVSRKKLKLELNFPTESEIKKHEENLRRDFLAREIEEFVEDYSFGILKTDVLEEIYRLINDKDSHISLFT